MAEALTLADVGSTGNGACAHERLALIKAAVGNFFQNPPANTVQRVDVQLKASLEAAAGRSLTNAQVARAVRLWVNDQ